jgi:hypothetical protein
MPLDFIFEYIVTTIRVWLFLPKSFNISPKKIQFLIIKIFNFFQKKFKYFYKLLNYVE